MARQESTIGVFTDITAGRFTDTEGDDRGYYVHSDNDWVGDSSDPGIPTNNSIRYEGGAIVTYNGSIYRSHPNLPNETPGLLRIVSRNTMGSGTTAIAVNGFGDINNPVDIPISNFYSGPRSGMATIVPHTASILSFTPSDTTEMLTGMSQATPQEFTQLYYRVNTDGVETIEPVLTRAAFNMNVIFNVASTAATLTINPIDSDLADNISEVQARLALLFPSNPGTRTDIPTALYFDEAGMMPIFELAAGGLSRVQVEITQSYVPESSTDRTLIGDGNYNNTSLTFILDAGEVTAQFKATHVGAPSDAERARLDLANNIGQDVGVEAIFTDLVVGMDVGPNFRTQNANEELINVGRQTVFSAAKINDNQTPEGVNVGEFPDTDYWQLVGNALAQEFRLADANTQFLTYTDLQYGPATSAVFQDGLLIITRDEAETRRNLEALQVPDAATIDFNNLLVPGIQAPIRYRLSHIAGAEGINHLQVGMTQDDAPFFTANTMRIILNSPTAMFLRGIGSPQSGNVISTANIAANRAFGTLLVQSDEFLSAGGLTIQPTGALEGSIGDDTETVILSVREGGIDGSHITPRTVDSSHVSESIVTNSELSRRSFVTKEIQTTTLSGSTINTPSVGGEQVYTITIPADYSSGIDTPYAPHLSISQDSPVAGIRDLATYLGSQGGGDDQIANLTLIQDASSIGIIAGSILFSRESNPNLALTEYSNNNSTIGATLDDVNTILITFLSDGEADTYANSLENIGEADNRTLLVYNDDDDYTVFRIAASVVRRNRVLILSTLGLGTEAQPTGPAISLGTLGENFRVYSPNGTSPTEAVSGGEVRFDLDVANSQFNSMNFDTSSQQDINADSGLLTLDLADNTNAADMLNRIRTILNAAYGTRRDGRTDTDGSAPRIEVRPPVIGDPATPDAVSTMEIRTNYNPSTEQGQPERRGTITVFSIQGGSNIRTSAFPADQNAPEGSLGAITNLYTGTRTGVAPRDLIGTGNYANTGLRFTPINEFQTNIIVGALDPNMPSDAGRAFTDLESVLPLLNSTTTGIYLDNNILASDPLATPHIRVSGTMGFLNGQIAAGNRYQPAVIVTAPRLIADLSITGQNIFRRNAMNELMPLITSETMGGTTGSSILTVSIPLAARTFRVRSDVLGDGEGEAALGPAGTRGLVTEFIARVIAEQTRSPDDRRNTPSSDFEWEYGFRSATPDTIDYFFSSVDAVIVPELWDLSIDHNGTETATSLRFSPVRILSEGGFNINGLTVESPVSQNSVLVDGNEQSSAFGLITTVPEYPRGQTNSSNTDYNIRVEVDSQGQRSINWVAAQEGTQANGYRYTNQARTTVNQFLFDANTVINDNLATGGTNGNDAVRVRHINGQLIIDVQEASTYGAALNSYELLADQPTIFGKVRLQYEIHEDPSTPGRIGAQTALVDFLIDGTDQSPMESGVFTYNILEIINARTGVIDEDLVLDPQEYTFVPLAPNGADEPAPGGAEGRFLNSLEFVRLFQLSTNRNLEDLSNVDVGTIGGMDDLDLMDGDILQYVEHPVTGGDAQWRPARFDPTSTVVDSQLAGARLRVEHNRVRTDALNYEMTEPGTNNEASNIRRQVGTSTNTYNVFFDPRNFRLICYVLRGPVAMGEVSPLLDTENMRHAIFNITGNNETTAVITDVTEVMATPMGGTSQVTYERVTMTLSQQARDEFNTVYERIQMEGRSDDDFFVAGTPNNRTYYANAITFGGRGENRFTVEPVDSDITVSLEFTETGQDTPYQHTLGRVDSINGELPDEVGNFIMNPVNIVGSQADYDLRIHGIDTGITPNTPLPPIREGVIMRLAGFNPVTYHRAAGATTGPFITVPNVLASVPVQANVDPAGGAINMNVTVDLFRTRIDRSNTQRYGLILFDGTGTDQGTDRITEGVVGSLTHNGADFNAVDSAAWRRQTDPTDLNPQGTFSDSTYVLVNTTDNSIVSRRFKVIGHYPISGATGSGGAVFFQVLWEVVEDSGIYREVITSQLTSVMPPLFPARGDGTAANDVFPVGGAPGSTDTLQPWEVHRLDDSAIGRRATTFLNHTGRSSGRSFGIGLRAPAGGTTTFEDSGIFSDASANALDVLNNTYYWSGSNWIEL